MKSISAIVALSVLSLAQGFVAPSPAFAKTNLQAVSGDEIDFDGKLLQSIFFCVCARNGCEPRLLLSV